MRKQPSSKGIAISTDGLPDADLSTFVLGVESKLRHHFQLSPKEQLEAARGNRTIFPAMIEGHFVEHDVYQATQLAAQHSFNTWLPLGVSRESFDREFIRALVTKTAANAADGRLFDFEKFKSELLRSLGSSKADWQYALPVYFFDDPLLPGLEVGPVKFVRGSSIEKEIAFKGPREQHLTETFKELGAHKWLAVTRVAEADFDAGYEKAHLATKLALAFLDLLANSRGYPNLRVMDDFHPQSRTYRAGFSDALGVSGGTSSFYPHTSGEPGKTVSYLGTTQDEIAWVGRALRIITSLSTVTQYPRLKETWLTGLQFYGLGRDAREDSVGVIHYAAALDVTLARGTGSESISEFLAFLLGRNVTDVVVSDPSLTVEELVYRIYSEGRSNSIHGGLPIVSADQSRNRVLGQAAARVALLTLIPPLKAYDAGGVAPDDWNTFRKAKLRSRPKVNLKT